MDFTEISKQFTDKYFPRNHLYIAGALSILCVLLILIPGGKEEAAVPAQTTQIPIPVTFVNEESVAKRANLPSRQLVLEDYVVTDEPVLEDYLVTDEPVLEDYLVTDEPVLEDVTLWQNIEVESGDNLSAIFTKVGLSDQQLFRVLNSSDEAKVLNRLYPGYQLDFMIPDAGELEQLRVLKSPLEGYLFTRNNNDYEVEPILKEAQIQQAFKVGEIADSLFMAGQREQIPAVHIMDMANIFGGVIDFILDPRAGDQFSILYDEQYLDGEFVGNGQILTTQFTNQGKKYTAVRYINEEGEAGYYSPEGESMRKAFLRNPLDVFRISSNFNPRRRHPISNTIRAHKGTDYAAPTGTPIRATSDGRVTRASRYGSFGKLVIVKHAGGFETKYAHLSRYARGISRGDRVRQGDIIGYVGATGGATGPHLHYEFLVNGVHQNPRTILNKLPKAVSIEPAEMERFNQQTAGLLLQFEELNTSRLLILNQPSAD
jgi:murein DD-endopeptidase MepM/ murein hydrolase activator NlpD